MQKLKQFDANLITQTFFPEVHPRDINSGKCCNWAYYAYLLFPNVQLCSIIDKERLLSGEIYLSHAYVKLEDRLYDSETPNGALHFNGLKSVIRWRRTLDIGISIDYCEIIYKYENRFQGAWSPNRVDWREIEEKARKSLKEIDSRLKTVCSYDCVGLCSDHIEFDRMKLDMNYDRIRLNSNYDR